MIKAVVFDMDGIIVDSEIFYLRNGVSIFKSLGLEVKEEELVPLIGGAKIHFETVLTSILSKHNLSNDLYQEASKEFYTTKPIIYSEIVDNNIHEILSYLKSNNYKLALASSSKVAHIKKVIEQCDLESYFDVILSGEMFVESKPNPEIYLVCANKLHLKPSECLAIEDSSYGIAAATKAGYHVIAKRETRYKMDQSQAKFFINNLLEIKDILKIIE